MRIVLFAMPDTSDILETVGRLPNLALASLAGSVKGHDVHILDLILKKPGVKKAINETINTYNPQVIGLSAMTFQFDTLLRIAAYIKSTHPDIQIVIGGYHATLMYKEITENDAGLPVDFIVRGEGEITFAALIKELEQSSPDFQSIKGLSYRSQDSWVHNPKRDLLEISKLPLPDRSSRLDSSFNILDKSMDVIETSRGCPNNCKFCCITHMYGHSFRPFPIERVVADLKSIKANGTRSVFIIDDNITHSIDHFKSICNAIIENNLNDMHYMTQVTAAGMANNPDLVELMDKANFRIIFVGFESMDPDVLRAIKKPTSPKINQQAAAILRKHNMAIIAGTIVGFANDTKESIKKQLQQIRSLVPDSIYVQYITPYPKTILREEMLAADLVVNKDDFSQYNGFSCVVRTKYLSRDELYKAKKIECLKPYFNLKMIWNNYFLRNYFMAFVVHEAKTIAMLLLNILTLKQRKNDIDI
ncbi:Fe-S oxidoreductase [Desulfocapsa sulfexigens DSM 10523]|uniref:Fe-S oxidoreductase n=1 Tax=Desulfocapsa sulfexigens (strain DSM 10523 / SB164P1) TaxID=1167006 RepID=M1PFV9_DESSD|nr:radical SAM protein [Desulfocapsa sulfexigens]AGF78560.1 Fe-S oxidoreductase [Desulfocapsa sulfexigens DSM 10523]